MKVPDRRMVVVDALEEERIKARRLGDFFLAGESKVMCA